MKFSLETAVAVIAIVLCTVLSPTNSIINGRKPTPNEAKYAAGIVSTVGECSGGILDNTHVITAAHCIGIGANSTLTSMKVYVATNDVYNFNSSVSIEKDVIRAYMLASYNDYKPSHDIAVLQLSESLEIEKNSNKLSQLTLPRPITLDPITYADYFGEKYLGVGYGNDVYSIVNNNGIKTYERWGAGQLNVANSIVVNPTECNKFYGKDIENRMCVAVIEDPQRQTFQGYCQGDSGAPIVLNDSVVIGVYIASANCNDNEQPGIASRTTAFISFVKNAMSDNITSDMLVYNRQ